MLLKIFGKKKSNDASVNIPRQEKPVSGWFDRQSRALKIIHAGGHAETYYMAIPASTIIEKHHSFILARPEIFRRPWDAVVRPDEILVPGQKYYLVPRRTVVKLRHRIRRSTAKDPPSFSFSSQHKDGMSSSVSGILVKPGLIKAKARNLHVRFFGIDTTSNQKPGPEEKRVMKPDKKPTARNEINAWEPSLQSITESE